MLISLLIAVCKLILVILIQSNIVNLLILVPNNPLKASTGVLINHHAHSVADAELQGGAELGEGLGVVEVELEGHSGVGASQ